MSARRQLVLFGIVTTLATAQGVAQAAPVLSIDVASPIGGGEVVDAQVNVADVTDLYAYQFDLRFDPAVIGAVSVTEGGFLPGAGVTFFDPGTIDNALGTITFVAGTLVGALSGASGSGTLATIRFTGLALGTSVLSLENVILLDSGLADIAGATSTSASVDVVAEPGTLLLVGAGIAAIVRRRARLGHRA